MKDSKIKSLIVVFIIAILFAILYFVFSNIFKESDIMLDDNIESLKNYKVNEYIPTYVSDEAMARIYLNEYIYNMYYDTKKAYELLDIEYRNKKFGKYENYISYLNNLSPSSHKLERYYKTTKNGVITFGVYDDQGLFYAFKTTGVLQYTVYLDDYTVEI